MNRTKHLQNNEYYNHERIVDLRKDRGLTQAAVAEKLKMSQRNYSHIETGEYDISGNELRILAELLQTSADYLLGLTDVRQQYPPSHNYKIKIKR